MNGHLYRLVSRDGTGVFLGLSTVECSLVGAGLASTIGLRLAGIPVTIAALPVLVAAAVAKVRVSGRPIHQWLALLAAWCVAVVRRRHRWRAPLPLLPAQTAGSAAAPPMLRGLDILELRDGGRAFGAVRDRQRACLTAVLPVRGTRFAGRDPSAQDALLSAWGQALAAHAGGADAVVQVGWSQQVSPAGLGDHRDWVRQVRPSDGHADLGDEAGYVALVDDVAGEAVSRETLVWITVAGTRAAGRGGLLGRAEAALPAATGTLAAGLRDAGLSVDEPLSVLGLWRLLRRRGDPHEDAGGSGSLATRMGLIGNGDGHPLAVDTAWSELRIDGSWHRLYWVEAWPRRPVAGDWLLPFLSSLTSGTMTVLHRPVDPERSRRRVDGQLVKLSAHRLRKEDKARRVTEVDRRTEGAAHDLEAELAAGYAEMLYLGLVCVSAPTREALEVECRAVEHAARSAQLGLRILHGRQDSAWAGTLPFGLVSPGLSDEVGL